MDVPPLLYGYIVLSCILVVGFAVYLAIRDYMSYYRINGHMKDTKFGYNYGSALGITLGFLFCLLPFLNILTISLYFILLYKNKKRYPKVSSLKVR